VTFDSEAGDLVADDTNGATDIFVHDQQTGETTRVSVDSMGRQSHGFEDGPPIESDGPSISGDGRFVAFFSNAIIPDTKEHNHLRGNLQLISV
jgi:hypothetical protein